MKADKFRRLQTHVSFGGMLLSGVAVTGCQFIPGTDNYLEKAATTIVAASLSDPESSKFRSLKIGKILAADGKSKVVCGEVNGRNGFGAYAGFRRFTAIPGGNNSVMIDPGSSLTNDDINREGKYCSEGISSACAQRDKLEEEWNYQLDFDRIWNKMCS